MCGLCAWEWKAESRTGRLMTLAGFTWFVGSLAPVALFWHRGPLVHLHISYPTGRLRRRLAAATVVVAYAGAVIALLAHNDVVTVVVSALVMLAAYDVFVRTRARRGRAAVPALAAALAYAGVLAAGALERLAGWDADSAVLLAYDVVVASVAVVLLVDLLFGRWNEATVADLVVALGQRGGTGSLRHQLSRALGDPSLEVGYWIAERERYVDDAGRDIELPAQWAGRRVTEIGGRGSGSRYSSTTRRRSMTRCSSLRSRRRPASPWPTPVCRPTSEFDSRSSTRHVDESSRRVTRCVVGSSASFLTGRSVALNG